MRFATNRKNFAERMEAQGRGQRGGLFSIPLGLTIGDGSTNYQKDRRESEECGRLKGFANERGRATTTDTFNKLSSNAIGDSY